MQSACGGQDTERIPRTSLTLPDGVPKEARNTPFYPSQEKFHTVVLRGVGNVSETPVKPPCEISPAKADSVNFPPPKPRRAGPGPQGGVPRRVPHALLPGGGRGLPGLHVLPLRPHVPPAPRAGHGRLLAGAAALRRRQL